MWILALFSIISTVLNIYQNKYCFVIWIVTNAAWCVIDFNKELYQQALLFLVYFIFSIWGLIKWVKNERNI